MAPKDLDKLIEKFLQGKCTREESDFINSWYSGLGKHPDQTSVKDFEDKLLSAETRMLRHLAKFAAPLSEEKEMVKEKSRSFFWVYSGIAASLFLLLGIGFYFLNKNIAANQVAENKVGNVSHITPSFTSVENPEKEVKRIILPDGSIVEMNPKSKIWFSNDVQSPARELFLEGEAYFDVAHNNERPFYVYAGNIVTKVVGTSFIIRTTDEDKTVTVSVKTGKVTVYSKNAAHKKTVLVPNQEAVYDKATDVVATQAVPAKLIEEHKRAFAEMHFEETPVSEVLALLTRTYDIDIVFREETLSGCVLTSSFFEEGLYDRIDVICTAIGATYKIVDARIIIESKGCKP